MCDDDRECGDGDTNIVFMVGMAQSSVSSSFRFMNVAFILCVLDDDDDDERLSNDVASKSSVESPFSSHEYSTHSSSNDACVVRGDDAHDDDE